MVDEATDAADRGRFEQAADEATRGSGQRVRFDRHHRHNPVLVAARFQLDNGLRILLMPDQRAPIFAYQTWFRVGSRHEDPKRTGLAHLFEHLMFKGTENHATGVFDREMELRGGQTNAATWVDWTYYTEALAARGDNLATVIGLETDRMTRLILDEETFRSELEVVKNERRMSVEDSVTGALNEKLCALAYTQHPYRWPTIGAMEHLEASTVDDLERFYRTHYAPNNATVVVVGALDPADTLTRLARAYGPLPRQDVPPPTPVSEPRQQTPRFALIERPVAAPQMVVGFHAPAQNDPDYAAVEMLSELLVVGDNARLHRRLVVEERLASDVVGYVSPFADPGLYELGLTLFPNVEPERLLSVLQEELDRLASEGPSAVELEKARNGLELAWLEGFATAEGSAEALGHFETNFGDFASAFAGPALWGAVDADTLRRVASEVFRAGNRTAVAAVAPAEAA